jgi:TRAP-type C4-dicarboxylate transport system substrate-binding protein
MALQPASAQKTFNFTMASFGVPGETYTTVNEKFPERIAKATGGRIKINVSYSLYPADQQVAALRDGRVDMIGGVPAYVASEAPFLAVSNLPGLVNDVAEYKLLLDAFQREVAAKTWREKYNGVVLAQGAFSPQVILSKTPIRKISDFKGVKIRVHNSQTAVLMNALGAKPTPVAGTETLQALDRGVVDAVIQAVAQTYATGFPAIAKFVKVWPIATIQPWTILINARSWESLPPDLQATFAGEMRKIEEEQWAAYPQNVAEFTAKWREKSVDFSVATKDEIAELNSPQYTKPVYDSWLKRTKELGLDGEGYIAKVKAVLGKP